MSMDEEMLRARQAKSQRAFYGALAGGSPDAHLVELDGVQATVVPLREWFSIFNGVFYESAGVLEAAYERLARAYGDAGVKAWTVWVPPGDDEGAELLATRGHELDSTPMLFVAAIDDLDLRRAVELDLEPEPTWRLVAEVNDQAYGVLAPWTMTAVFETMSDPASHLYVARDEGVAASALIAREHEGDCYFWFVGTAPEARGRGLAGELMRHALRNARDRGCTTTTLESSKMAETLYAGLGYRALGRYEMWELRRS